MRELKIGDRFQYYVYIFEITGLKMVNGMYPCICIESDNGGWSIGQTGKFFFRDGWTYVGNFSKSQNFTNLYELLSEKPASHINP